MKNLKKIALGLVIGATAIGFSAFINAPKAFTGTSRFYNISGDPASEDPLNFVYDDGLTDHCAINVDDECTAQWTTTNMPSTGQTPADAGSPVYAGNTTTGDYNGDVIP